MDNHSIRPAIPDDIQPAQLMRGMVLAAPFAAVIWFILLLLLAVFINA